MTTIVVRRPPRRAAPPFPHGEFPLQEPPALPEAQGGQVSMLFMYLPMAAASGVMMLMFIQPGATGRALTYVAAGLMVVAMAAMGLAQLARAISERKLRLKGERRDYLRYLSQARRTVRQAIDSQRESMAWIHPDPGRLWAVAGSDRLWERRNSHHDFCEVRVGVGTQRLALKLQAPQTKPVEDLEPLCASALRRFMQAYSSVTDLPMAVYLRSFARILLAGDDETVRGAVRALVGQLVTFHSPEDLRIAICAKPERLGEWDWVKWLPHALHPTEHDAAGPVRLVATEWDELEALLGAEQFTERGRFDPKAKPSSGEPYLVILLDGVELVERSRPGNAGYRSTTVVDIARSLPWHADRITLRLRMKPDAVEMVEVDRAGVEKSRRIGKPDSMALARCRRLALQIAPFRANVVEERADSTSTEIDLAKLLGVGEVTELTAESAWQPRSPWDFLRVPIGLTERGAPVELDIKESAQGGMGPHGILIGATGSGKSELLRTLVLAMALTHSSEVLNLVLVDFKGGATFAGLDGLPHVSAFITNLADALPLVDRMQDALHGELVRRQEHLRAAGYSSAYDYEKARASGTELEPMPTLFVVVDEFGELLANKSEFMDLFVMIGRLGRSLGVHLLLASQRLEEGRIHQLETHLSYRIGLRMFSQMESRSVIGVSDAYDTPLTPGSGFLRTDTTTLVRFRGAYVSAPVRKELTKVSRRVIEGQVMAYAVGYQAPPAPVVAEPVQAVKDETGVAVDTFLQVAVDRLRDQGPHARPVWLPPLEHPPALNELLPDLVRDPHRGLGVARKDGGGALACPVGIVDLPFEQRHDLLTADLSAGKGHVGIVGAVQMGKSTLVRTLVAGIALTHTPAEVQFYLLDFGGGSLTTLSGLPHVGGVAGRLEKEKVKRIIVETATLLGRREQRFSDLNVDSIAGYRKMRREGKITDDPYGDVFLVVDGWFTLHSEFEALEPYIQEIVSRGLNYGIHIVVAATRWSEIRPWLRDLLGTRFELRLGDPVDSEVDFRKAKEVPSIPGRGLTKEKFHYLSALPRIDTRRTHEDSADGTRAMAEALTDAWSGPPAPPIRMLPTTLPAAELPPPPDSPDLKVALGLNDATLSPVWHDFGQTPHLIAFGDTETGKTNLLRLIVGGICRRFSPAQARILFADPRRQLHTSAPPDYHLGYAVSETTLRELAEQVAESLRKRVPGTQITPDRLAKRDWWSGPQLFLVIDDYDLLASGMSSPMEPLASLVAQGVEVGLHVVVARTSAGAMRAMNDSVIRKIWETGSPGLLFSYRREEGTFLGDARAMQLPRGRAQLVDRRRGIQLVQTGLAPVEENPPTP